MGEITFSGFIKETIYVLVIPAVGFLDIDVCLDIGLKDKIVVIGVGGLHS